MESKENCIEINQLISLAEVLNDALQKNDLDSANQIIDSKLKEYKVKNPDLLKSYAKDVSAIKNQKINKPSLRSSAVTGCTLLHIAAWLDYPEFARFLLDNRKMQIEAKTAILQSPLNIAATGNSVKTARVLIEKGADIESCAKHEVNHQVATHTPLIRACGGGGERLEMIELLLNSGANPQAMTFRNAFPDSQEVYRTAVHLLIDNFYKAKSPDQKERVIKAIDLIIDKVPKSKREDFLAIREICTERNNRRLSTLELVIEQIKDAQTQNKSEEIEYLRKIRDVLIEYGAKLDHKDKTKKPVKVGDLLNFWVAFAVPNEIIQVLLSFESASKFLISKHFDLSDKKTRFCFCLCVAAAICTIVCLYNRDCLPNSELKDCKINNGLDVDNLGL
jgi:ankyrin repeat protein